MAFTACLCCNPKFLAVGNTAFLNAVRIHFCVQDHRCPFQVMPWATLKLSASVNLNLVKSVKN